MPEAADLLRHTDPAAIGAWSDATVARRPPAVPQLRLLRGARPGPRPGRPRTGGGAGVSGFTDELPYGVFSRPGESPRVGVAIGERVLDVGAALPRGEVDPADFAQPSLNAFHGPRPGGLGGDPDRPATAAGRPADAGTPPGPAGRGAAAPAHRGRGLRRLLRLRAPRQQRGPDLPAGRSAADAELEAHADRLPRPRRHGGGLGHRRRPAARSAQGPERPGAAVRPERQAGHRGRAGLGGRGGLRPRHARSRSTASPSTSSAW